MPLRAEMPVTVIAEIRSRLRIVGTVGLHAVSDRIIAARGRRHRNHAAVVIISVVFVARRIIARSAVIAVALRGQRAANRCTRDCAGNEAAVTVTAVAIISATTISATTAAAAATTSRT